MADEGVNIALADMDPPAPDPVHGWMVWPDDFTAENGGVDDTHPNDYGYAKMAAIWYDAIDKAYSNDLIHDAAVTSASAGGGSCEKSFGDGIYAGGLTQRASGEDDGIYHHASESKGVQTSFWDPKDDLIEKIFFARLITPAKDELVIYEKQFDKTKEHNFDVYDDCIPRGVQFIDINGDGLDDFVCIAKDGTAYASVNNGDGTKWKAPTFTRIGKWKDSEEEQIIVLSLITVISNAGETDGLRFTGKGMGDIAGMRFEDINGDGCDDWLWVDEDGTTTTYTNSRSCIKGKEGDGLNIVWRQGFQKGKSSGPTHLGMSSFGKSSLRSHIFFTRIYGEPQDFGLLGRQDYIFVERKEADDGDRYDYYFYIFKNVGSGATKIKYIADRNRYCNMMGHVDGRMDYVWILSKGDMRIYPNKGMNDFSDSLSSYWGANYVIFDPAKLSIGMDLDRRDLHLVDWDGDGVYDIIWTDPKNNNKPYLWRNNIKKTGDFNWKYDANPAPDLKCLEKGGVGFFDRPVYLADITGSMEGSYTYFPDLNGDGLADMHAIIHSTKNTAKTWYNGCTGKNHVGDNGPIEDPDLPILPQEDGVIIHYKDGSCSRNCPNYDYIQIDKSPILGINRYAYFGDSNNYGKLIDTWLDAEKLTYESHACSGDTTVGLNGQIDTWLHNDPKSTNIGTLTMGGNDVGFSDLVRNYIITSGWYDIDTYRKSCLEAESKALDYIYNSGDGRLGAKLRSAYKRIVNGANDNFHLHVPGYGSVWEEKQNPDKYVYLTRDLRKELNNLVGALNDLISATIAAANNELSSKRIHYIDMQSHFDSHRWCEADVREPDPNGNSFFFLTGWNDQGTNDITMAGLSVTEADEL
ncbi:uncharacterized protein N7518_005799 [Penicillium psychrosexuale]|uniref:uncharacterized protein n=1 Tax=Penicillium psychrosexuale TaxID=1002107 RepID=UPI002545310C|nr:uncharacterized protein N7518_005799 [Penicillium psychrosexuale]KAJ5797259.1 hypothetical protein N7518_005799 [Penicillium psychrosexuale]